MCGLWSSNGELPSLGISGILRISGLSDLREPSCCAFVLWPPVIIFSMLELPSVLALGRCAGSTCVCCTQLSGPCLVLGFLELLLHADPVVCAHPGFFSHPSSSFIYLCPHFMFLSKLGTCPTILSMQLLSVLIQPQPPATLPSVHGWVSTLSSSLVGHMVFGGSFHQGLELWWGLCCWEICSV